ncbi:MAG TPA: glycosyltransferase family 39 protein [Bacteroidia bacterium]|nr:glycosyltransferase family 39 protein [Bacteroidia bacterium]
MIISIKFFFDEKYKKSLLFVFIIGLTLRAFVSSDPYLHDWDEKYHALVAKNLLSHFFIPTLYDNPILPYDLTNWTSNHIWLHKQPMSLWIISLSLKVFGISEFAVRVPSILFSSLCILFTYYIASNLINNKVALLSAFFMSINGLVVELTGGRVATDHVDIAFLFFIELSIVFSIIYSKNKLIVFNLLTGVFTGAAILSKWLPALIVLPIWIILIVSSGKFNIKEIFIQFLILILTILIVSLPWQIYIHYTFPKEAYWETTFNLRHFNEVIENQSGSSFYFIEKIRINYGELIYLPLIWFVVNSIKKAYPLKNYTLLVWFLIPLIFFSLAKTKMQAYLLFASPAFFIITAYFAIFLTQVKNTKYKYLQILIFSIIILTHIRYCIERLKPYQINNSKMELTSSIKNLNQKNFTNKDILFNCNYPIELMFYTNVTAYSEIPDSKTIQDLIEKGYNIYIINNDKIKHDYENLNGVNLIDLGF